eukprot:TRINITY_DN25412_c0_g1_i1.p1 TRINITY_DN25412_c0_g1~~TRINITY_DN25412_c0_g1_i1.p1  ORF type:complete len:378 (-),score=62.86 TRINITY_DN25412_c0_g1_i1:30-1163(-)
MNRDEAERCLDLGKEAESNGDYDKAFKFYTKSVRLWENPEAQAALSNLERVRRETKKERTASDSSSSSRSASEPSRSSNTSSATSSSGTGKYTPEQKEIVTKINKCKDYYEILGVTKSATEDEIKNKYKKLALKMHPDKNHAPGAEDAFKKVGQAFSCLSDPEKRRMYDLRGSDDDVPSQPSAGQRRRHAYDGDLTPEEIFQMFFGGQIPRSRNGGGPFATYSFGHDPDREYAQRQRQRAAQRHAQAQPREEGSSFLATLLQFLPLILILFFSFFAGSSSREPLYQFQQSNSYSVLRQTSNMDVPYYVKPATPLDRRLETDVEENYVHLMRQQCVREQRERQRRIDATWWFSSDVERKRAREYPTPACDWLFAHGQA